MSFPVVSTIYIVQRLNFIINYQDFMILKQPGYFENIGDIFMSPLIFLFKKE